MKLKLKVVRFRGRSRLRLLALLVLAAFFIPPDTMSQSGYTLWGDVRIDDSKASNPAPSSLTIVVYDQSTKIVGRQTIGSRGRYRFSNLRGGEYDISIEANGAEIVRTRLNLTGSTTSDFRQDFEFQWKENIAARTTNVGIISAADFYDRPANNKALFEKAHAAVEKKDYANAVYLLTQIVEKDRNDFQCWTLLGTLYLAEEKSEEAEKAYLTAIELKPTYALPLIKLGKLRLSQKKFDAAVDVLTRAVDLQSQSPEANLFLGEAYLHLKKGSKAIPYLNEAGKLGRIEAHLDLAWLYNAAGLKDKAVVEYEEVLRKKPDYPERKKLEQYISENKKP
jgi:tetratricopeptide (TPR) repeat protein